MNAASCVGADMRDNKKPMTHFRKDVFTPIRNIIDALTGECGRVTRQKMYPSTCKPRKWGNWDGECY